MDFNTYEVQVPRKLLNGEIIEHKGTWSVKTMKRKRERSNKRNRSLLYRRIRINLMKIDLLTNLMEIV